MAYMARPRRILFPNTVTMITARVQEGLPFVCTSYMDRIIRSALALAQFHHPIRIIGLVVMTNHIHLMALVENPEDVSGFMERFKTESSHAINRLLGRRQRTVWCEGYDSPVILTKEDLLRKLKYMYTNPAEAGLVRSIDDYPGVSSWRMLSNKIHEEKVLRIRRSMLEKLPSRSLSPIEQLAFTQKIEAKGEESLSLIIEPVAWNRCFKDETPEEFQQKLIEEIKQHEEDLRSRRGHKVIGEKQLRAQPFFKAHIPKKFSPRMWCICSDVSLRRSFISLIKCLKDKAKEVLCRWRTGDFSVPYPIGLFPPRFPRLANPLPPYIQI